ncbi:hypothetical protein PRIPAC_85400, partial [Pristionchus pacificus]|uniref:NADAR domain-containing protein n=1 Tax=Pristionchus pacificus TaxID=54126 RepID=A0A2A6BNN4_PRIPA
GRSYVLFYSNKSIYSNHHPSVFFDKGGVRYSTSEQYYMMRTACYFNDLSAAERIRKSNSKVAQKILVDQSVDLIIDDPFSWDTVSQNAMYDGLLMKFTQNMDMRKSLLDT